MITANSFTVQLNTTPVTLPAPTGEASPVRDVHADGDTAMLKIDGGLNINDVAGIDHVTPGSVAYGFEEFTDTCTPGYVWNGGGERRHRVRDVRADDRRHATCRGPALRHCPGFPSPQRRHWR